MQATEWISRALADPNVAYVLFAVGVIGLVAEFYNLGSLWPGVVGAASLALALVAFGGLPVNWVGLLLLLLAIGLLIAGLHRKRPGLPTAGGLVAFVLGSLTLFGPPPAPLGAGPEPRVSPWLVAAMTAVLGPFFLLARSVVKSARAPAATGAEALVGRVGIVASDLAPAGLVRIDGELWSAEAEGDQVGAGERVRVVGVEGVRLKVKRP